MCMDMEEVKACRELGLEMPFPLFYVNQFSALTFDSISPMKILSLYSILLQCEDPSLLNLLQISDFNKEDAQLKIYRLIDPQQPAMSLRYDGGATITQDEKTDSVCEDGVLIEIKKLGGNSRRIRSKIGIEASLDTVWNILTDYEKLADLIPGLAVSKVVEKKDKFARLFQIGQQKLPLGLKFNAKGVIECYEEDEEILPNGRKREIKFKMVEGDFTNFEGTWSIEEGGEGEEWETTLSYLVDVKPKMWLPVGLVQGRLSKEIKTNLSCIREEAKRC
ncbi:hypothetical protein GQ457_11G001920 [Hibiscus cannabinus]